MNQTPYERFANVAMPRWYRIMAWTLRSVGFVMLVDSAWHMTHQDGSGASWPIVGRVAGILLLVLPSLPNPYIEQRNRLRGLRDGSFKDFLDNEQRNR